MTHTLTLKWLGNPSEATELTADETTQILQLTSVIPGGVPSIATRWNKAVNDTTFYFVIWSNVNGPVGLIGWCGDAPAAEPSWWVHPRYQGSGYASAAVELLAARMVDAGVIDISKKVNIEVVYDFHGGQTERDLPGIAARSRALLVRLKQRFTELRSSRS